MASSAHTSPTRSAHPPNAHPYPIKTTSTGILTRSNSSNAHGSWARHKYSPAPPSPRIDASPTRSEMSVSPSPSKYTRSWRSPDGTRVKLPRHPYLWTPAHLGTYLSTALNGSDGEPLDPEIVQNIVRFVQEQKIGGRAFLGLDQEDFQEMDGVDATWAHAFWDAACTLRAAATPYRPSRVSSGVTKRGRVRGIVGVFERSASESSDVGEDESPHRTRIRGSSISGAGYDSTGNEADSTPLVGEVRESGGGESEKTSTAPTPRPSHTPVPRSPETDHDRTPHTREVEILSVTGAETEPSMAEIYEKTYGVRAPSPTHPPASESEEIELGETVKITVPEGVTINSPRGEVIALPTPAPPSLVELFVPASVPAPNPAPERRVLVPVPSTVAHPPAARDVFILSSSNDPDALHTIDALNTRLELVEKRIADIEHKDGIGEDKYAELEAHDDTNALWSDTRQSAYVLLAGAAAGVAIVLVPTLFRHLLTR